jgi:hypothetical protein
MSSAEFAGQIHRVLDDYEAREPQRVLEIIAYQVRNFIEGNSALPGPIEQIRVVVDAWERGERTDLDSLETIAAIARQI